MSRRNSYGISKVILLGVAFIVLFAGVAVFAYPYFNCVWSEYTMLQDMEAFLDAVCADSCEPTEGAFLGSIEQSEDAEPTTPEKYPELWSAMQAYNETIFGEGQAGLSNKTAYETPSFSLLDYGLESEVFAVLEIPSLDLAMPIYLGATKRHMTQGAAQLSQTSLPIGGNNTNCVLAGHRGWNGAAYFLYISKLEKGDIVTVTNLWETLTYEVVETKIISPNEVDEILIQENRDLLTLLTCHPPASGGKQRYLVFCERVYEKEDYD